MFRNLTSVIRLYLQLLHVFVGFTLFSFFIIIRLSVNKKAVIAPISAHTSKFRFYFTTQTVTMATRSSKRQKTSKDHPYELIYWPTIPGRGEHIRLAFEDTNTPYTDTCNQTDAGAQAVMDHVSDKNHGEDDNPPPFAPPILKHGELIISQTSNILMYLGPRLGLAPSPESDPDGIYQINSLTLTALDGLSNEAHDTHHPVGVGLYYEDQKPESKRKAYDYIENRLPKFLGYFERVLKSPSSGGGQWLYGGQISYADLVLFQCMNGNLFAFPKALSKMKESGKYDGVFGLYERVKGRSNVAKYLDSDRRMKYSLGVSLHLPSKVPCYGSPRLIAEFPLSTCPKPRCVGQSALPFKSPIRFRFSSSDAPA